MDVTRANADPAAQSGISLPEEIWAGLRYARTPLREPMYAQAAVQRQAHGDTAPRRSKEDDESLRAPGREAFRSDAQANDGGKFPQICGNSPAYGE
ncbi:hypothetical protein HDA40_006112 [Hamadaea flava]|uniref:Uncharacterized protein n=1 Tax=Hamadaea flava TaxID=1742688 RepID=A0ABV8LUY3_9ACTN|nr:hypothetical protein [Hamadaea flava]MCP2327605.1 hypothetical protein [Hamadaea flava]